MTKVHEKRFDPFNHFPVNISNNKPVRQVDFNKVLPRDDHVYKQVKCSDTLYEHKHLNLFKPKDVGILQFSSIGSKRGDEEKRMLKLKEYSNPQDNYLNDILTKGIGKNQTPRDRAGMPHHDNLMRGIDYRNTSLHYNRGITI